MVFTPISGKVRKFFGGTRKIKLFNGNNIISPEPGLVRLFNYSPLFEKIKLYLCSFFIYLFGSLLHIRKYVSKMGTKQNTK
jgi:hypothetical protein